MNRFHNVILVLTRQKQGKCFSASPVLYMTTHTGDSPVLGQTMMGAGRPVMGPGQQMPAPMNQPNPGYQQPPYNQFGGVGGANQVPNPGPSYPPGGNMGMGPGGMQRPQPPPQYHPGMYPPGANPNPGMHMAQQPRYPMPQCK